MRMVIKKKWYFGDYFLDKLVWLNEFGWSFEVYLMCGLINYDG